jgi:hypothetical protein
MKIIIGLAATLFFIGTASAQTTPVKIKVVYDTADASSSAVVPILVQKIAAYPKLFTLVKDDDKNLSVIADCYRETPADSFSCFYVATKQHGITESFLGGAIVVRKTPEEVAAALLSSIAQDIAERWNNTDRRMLIGELEACLALTESGCAVPEPLIPELKAKSINLSQYMRKGGLKP